MEPDDARAELNAIDRIHDDDPPQAARRLRAIDTGALASDDLGLLTFLHAHVLGEKFGAWDEAARRIDAALAGRDAVPLRALRNAAVAQKLAGNAAAASARAAELARAANAAHELAEQAVAAMALSFRGAADAPDALAVELRALARGVAAAGAPSAGSAGLDAAFAAAFNNATSALLDACTDRLIMEPRASALREGAAAARDFWLRAGNWVNHERADYLLACVLNRVGDPQAARAAAQRGLDLIAANGVEDVDRAFLLLQLAGAGDALGDTAQAAAALDEADRLAGGWDDPPLRDWFATERAKLVSAPVRAPAAQ